MKLKADFHIHAKGDPRDKAIRHTPFDIIDRAKDKGFDVISITCHNKVYFTEEIRKYAESKGMLFIPGVELDIHNRHVIILNPPSFDISGIKDFSDLKRFKEDSNALIIAPHPFFPGSSCLNSKFFQHKELFDAVEVNGVYLKWFNYNRNIKKLLKDGEFPIVGGSDTHFLNQLGWTYTLIEADKNINSVLDAIRAKRVEVVSEPLSIKNNGLVTMGMFCAAGVIRETFTLFRKYISAFCGIFRRVNS